MEEALVQTPTSIWKWLDTQKREGSTIVPSSNYNKQPILKFLSHLQPQVKVGHKCFDFSFFKLAVACTAASYAGYFYMNASCSRTLKKVLLGSGSGCLERQHKSSLNKYINYQLYVLLALGDLDSYKKKNLHSEQ